MLTQNSTISKTGKVTFLAFLMLMSFVSYSQSIAYKTLLSTLYDKEFPILKPEEIKDLSNYQVLDTREKDEYDVSHLQNSLWVGYDTFDFKKTEDLDKEKPVLVYCTVGARSQDIGKKLKEAGFKNVYNLYGGIIQWSNDGLPLYKNNETTDKVHTYSKSWGIWLNKGEKVY
jgi:rhodanese-related sulfurtransferase